MATARRRYLCRDRLIERQRHVQHQFGTHVDFERLEAGHARAVVEVPQLQQVNLRREPIAFPNRVEHGPVVNLLLRLLVNVPVTRAGVLPEEMQNRIVESNRVEADHGNAVRTPIFDPRQDELPVVAELADFERARPVAEQRRDFEGKAVNQRFFVVHDGALQIVERDWGPRWPMKVHAATGTTTRIRIRRQISAISPSLSSPFIMLYCQITTRVFSGEYGPFGLIRSSEGEYGFLTRPVIF
jgi:hypothetical protein